MIKTSCLDLYYGARTLIAEAGGESKRGQLAVAMVIVNRAYSKRSSVRDECLRRRQFSCWNRADANDYRRHDERAMHGQLASYELEAMATIVAALNHRLSKNMHDQQDAWMLKANHYYAPREMVPPGRVPSWARGEEPLATVGGHIFYELPY